MFTFRLLFATALAVFTCVFGTQWMWGVSSMAARGDYLAYIIPVVEAMTVASFVMLNRLMVQAEVEMVECGAWRA